MKNLAVLILFLSSMSSVAQVSVPRIFGDNMVLQRNKGINVWGWAKPKEKLNIRFHDQAKSTVAATDGKWKVTLDAEKEGGPYELVITGKSGTVSFKNILVGEVWVCSGQSNMEWPLAATENAAAAIAAANNPNIRHIKVPTTVASTPKSDIRGGEWKVCSPQTAPEFTAVGYYFAQKISKELNVPVGLINTTWGGTHSETWTSREAFETSDLFKPMIASMPNLDLETIAKQKDGAITAKLVAAQGHYPATKEEISQWAEPGFDDSKWPTMDLPNTWETQQWPDLDGTVWFRKSFDVSASDAGKPATIWLSMIDDSDETFINGVKVGATPNEWNKLREYQVKEGVLKAGRNIVAVRVHDTGGNGGIHGDAAMLHMKTASSDISLAGKWSYQVESVGVSSAIGPNDYPTLLYNAMLAPLIPYTIEGVLWYQGESNADRAYEYRTAFPLMITDWRKHWGQGDFPFYFVQLSSWNANNGNSEKGSTWAELREAQAYALKLPNTGMVITTDIGNRDDIHPRNKLDVGSRLGAVALANVYGQKVVFRGPTLKQVTPASNGKVYVEFTNTGSGLMVKDKYGYIRGFEVAGADGKFYPAQAFLEGDKVLVGSASVKQPVIVHYGWADDAGECNLFNKEGFPAEPFRTGDNDQFITKTKHFTLKQ